MNKFFHAAGSVTGKSAAYLVEGTALAGSSFAQGAKVGYADKAAELKARRAALAAPAPVVRQKKLAVAAA